jgi:histidinol-phosphate aminotransferase
MTKADLNWIEERMTQLINFKLYSGGESLYQISNRLGVKMDKLVKMNSNENFFLDRNLLTEKIIEVSNELDVRTYAQFEVKDLTEKISSWLGIEPNKVLVGNGSDQLLEIIGRIFLNDGKDAISISPTFTYYRILVALEGGRYFGVPLKRNFELDVDALLNACTPKTTLCLLCSPNNPTGNQFRKDDLIDFVERFNGIVVLDEAYADFSDYQMHSEVDKHPNLIVLRTFSKLFAFAGLRLGFTVANQRLTKVLSRLQQPYAVSTLTLRVGLKMLDEMEKVLAAKDRMIVEREKLVKEFDQIKGVKAFPSDANFILFKTSKRSKLVLEELIKKYVLVRHIRDVLHLGDCLRTTVGLPKMNRHLLDALKEIMK